MKYTIDDLEFDIEKLVGELSELRSKKGHDYSSNGDTLENLRLFGWQGIIVRMGDKLMRLKSFTVKGDLQCQDEKIEDTMQDLINYALYLLIMYRQEKYIPVKSEVVTKPTLPPCVPAFGGDYK